MRGQEDGDAAVTQAVDQALHVARRDGIEARRRLVEEEDGGVGEERASEADALAQALREIAGEIVRAGLEADRLERVPDSVRVPDAVEPGEELEVLRHCQAQIEARSLGHHRDPLPDLDPIRRRERKARDDCRSGGWRDQRPEHAHRRRLARAVRAEEAEHLSRSDRERDVVDRDAVPEPLGEVLDRERRRLHRLAPDRRRQESCVSPSVTQARSSSDRTNEASSASARASTSSAGAPARKPA